MHMLRFWKRRLKPSLTQRRSSNVCSAGWPSRQNEGEGCEQSCARWASSKTRSSIRHRFSSPFNPHYRRYQEQNQGKTYTRFFFNFFTKILKTKTGAIQTLEKSLLLFKLKFISKKIASFKFNFYADLFFNYLIRSYMKNLWFNDSMLSFIRAFFSFKIYFSA